MISLAVMKVEPSLPTVWALAAVFGGLGFWSARRWVWPGLAVLAWILLSLRGVHNAVTDPVNGPALLPEAGQGYVTQSYVAHALSIAATLVGLVWGFALWSRRRSGSRQ
jgi:hypothetical protein